MPPCPLTTSEHQRQLFCSSLADMVLRERDERKGGGKGMAEGGGDRLGGTQMTEGVSQSEPYPALRTSGTPEPEEAWKQTGGGSVRPELTSEDERHEQDG